jgi:hypothetical protein
MAGNQQNALLAVCSALIGFLRLLYAYKQRNHLGASTLMLKLDFNRDRAALLVYCRPVFRSKSRQIMASRQFHACAIQMNMSQSDGGDELLSH